MFEDSASNVLTHTKITWWPCSDADSDSAGPSGGLRSCHSSKLGAQVRPMLRGQRPHLEEGQSDPGPSTTKWNGSTSVGPPTPCYLSTEKEQKLGMSLYKFYIYLTVILYLLNLIAKVKACTSFYYFYFILLVIYIDGILQRYCAQKVRNYQPGNKTSSQPGPSPQIIWKSLLSTTMLFWFPHRWGVQDHGVDVCLSHLNSTSYRFHFLVVLRQFWNI